MNIINIKIIKRAILHTNVALLTIFIIGEWQQVCAVNTAIARGAKNQNKAMAFNARRQTHFKFGITYPPGVHPPRPTTQNPPTVGAPVFTMRPIISKDPYPWRTQGGYKTPPTMFFPRGSSPVTVTIFPVPHVHADARVIGNPCELYIRTCMKAYDTGYVCGRALFDNYFTFNSYCTMEFANCQSKTTMWQIAYFGNCQVARLPNVGEEFNIEGDNFLEAAIVNAPPFNPLTGKQETY